MNVLSLFSGIGGLDLGLERAGMTITGQVEIDPWCRKVLAKHWPEVPRHDDVRTCAEWWGGGTADLVCGGFPCQPVSVAGKGLAQADSRWLWPAFRDVVCHLRPGYVLVENVPGLLGRGMGDVLGDLADLGYDAEWDCVPAAFKRAPHIRNRVWLVAYTADGYGVDVPGVRGTLERQSRRGVPGHGSDALAHADGTRSPDRTTRPGGRSVQARWLEPERLGGQVADTGRIGRGNGPRIFGRLGAAERGRWPTEPDVGRVAHGVPARVDRLRGLGNAVVPQVAQHVGELIMEASRAMS